MGENKGFRLTAPAELPPGSQHHMSMKKAVLELIVVPVPNRYNRKQNFVITHKIMKNNGLKKKSASFGAVCFTAIDS